MHGCIRKVAIGYQVSEPNFGYKKSKSPLVSGGLLRGLVEVIKNVFHSRNIQVSNKES